MAQVDLRNRTGELVGFLRPNSNKHVLVLDRICFYDHLSRYSSQYRHIPNEESNNVEWSFSKRFNWYREKNLSVLSLGLLAHLRLSFGLLESYRKSSTYPTCISVKSESSFPYWYSMEISILSQDVAVRYILMVLFIFVGFLWSYCFWNKSIGARVATVGFK